MTGLLYALAPLVAAAIVARREPAHRPIHDALGASALYSVAALPFVASHLDARVGLGLFALVAVASGRAYLYTFCPADSEPNGWRAYPIITFPFVCGIAIENWRLATWGPFVASSVVGALAVWAWWATRIHNERRVAAYLERGFDEDGAPISVHDLKLPTSASITERCALIPLASDVCMLAFIRWGGVQMWQGRAAAVAVALIQVTALCRPKPDTRSAP